MQQGWASCMRCASRDHPLQRLRLCEKDEWTRRPKALPEEANVIAFACLHLGLPACNMWDNG